MFQTKANQKKMAEIDLFTFPPLDTEHTARWAEVSNPHPGQRNATAPGASTRLTEMVTSLQDLPSNNSSKRHPCHPFNACRCPKNDTQVVCKNAVILRFGWTNRHPQILRLHEPYEPCPTELKAFMQFLQTQGRQGSIPRAARQLHLEARRPGGGPPYMQIQQSCVICGPCWNKGMPIWAVCCLF